MKFICCLLAISLCAAISSGGEPTHESDVAYRKTIELEIKGKKGKTFKATSEVSVEIVYLSEHTTKFNEVYIYRAGPEEVDKVKARLNGSKLGKRNVTQLVPKSDKVFGSETRLYAIKFAEKVKPGDTGSYSYRVKYDDIAYLPLIKIPNLNSVEQFELKIKHPKEVKVEYEAFFPLGEIVPITHYSLGKESRISFGPIAYQDELPFFEFNEVRGYLLLRFLWEGEEINPVSPQSYTDWYGSQIDLRPVISRVIFDALDLDFCGRTSALDSLAVIHDYVRGNIRYISDLSDNHAILPHAPSRVLSNKYGDCKDRAYLVSALARYVGIPVHLAIVTSRPFIDFQAVHTYLFNHVICCYAEGDRLIFFDPTARYLPFGSIPEDIVDHKAFILDPDNPRYADIQSTIDAPTIDIHITGQLDSLKNCRAEITLRQDPLAGALRAKSELAGHKLQQQLSKLATSHLARISVDSLEFADEQYDAVTLSGTADLTDFVVGSGERKYISQTPFVSTGNRTFDRENDPWPIQYEHGAYFSLTVELASEGYRATPDSFIVTGPNGMLNSGAVSNADPGNIVLSYIARRVHKSIPDSLKSEYIETCRRLLGMKNEMFIINEGGF